MLNGIDPIIIFSFRKNIAGIFTTLNSLKSEKDGIPDATPSPQFPLPLIPIYLSETLTGIYIDSESKNIEIDTQIDTSTQGLPPKYYQKGLTNTVKIQMVANRNSLGVSLFSAMADLIFPKVTSNEYSVTYLHGAITVFNGLLHSFSVDQNAENDLYKITLELQAPPLSIVSTISTQVSRAGQSTALPQVSK